MDDLEMTILVQRIIERSRHHDEGFLTDCRGAAEAIVKLYNEQKLLEKETNAATAIH